MKNYIFKGETLTEDMKLSEEWWDFFLNHYEIGPNFPNLTHIACLANAGIKSSQCGHILKKGWGASFDTTIPVIEVASAIGYITLDQRNYHYKYMKNEMEKWSRKKRPSQRAYDRIMYVAG